jgi:hypothetical protein
MPILIAHRGNTIGPNPDSENELHYLHKAITNGYDVEVDVWYVDKQWYFGHYGPTIPVSLVDVEAISDKAWFHAKNYLALCELDGRGHHVFAHDKDPFVVTNRGWIWSHQGQENPAGIVVMPSLITEQALIINSAGICHDNLLKIEYLLLDNASRYHRS